MTLDELHEKLTADSDTFLEQLRAEEAEREKRFPGYPSYLNDETLQRIEKDVERHAAWMREVLGDLFGHLAVQQLPPEKLRYYARELATRVAHRVAGHMATEGVRQADQASRNMINGVLAGIAMRSTEKSPEKSPVTDEPGDAR